MADAPSPSFPTIPGYRIVQELGRGALSVVYRACRLGDPSQQAAIKLLWPFTSQQEARFEREIRALRALDVPSIVKCFDSGRIGGGLYFAMELVEGLPLDEYLARRAPRLEDKLAVFERVCRAVAQVHGRGVAHRDLKPRNILIDSGGQPHLLDFGLCAITPQEWEESSHAHPTRPGDVQGTVRYMSPEQAWGGLVGGPIDHQTDVWALGIMLYEIATLGDYPFELRPEVGKTAEESLLQRIRSETPRPPTIPSPDHRRDLARLIDRCLAWDKQDRLSSASALADDLQRIGRRQPIRTRGMGLLRRLRRGATGLAVAHRPYLWIAHVGAVLVAVSAAAYATGARWLAPRGMRADRAAARSVGSGAAPDDAIRVIGLTDECAREVPGLAAAAGARGVSEDIRTWRGLHGRIMERLAAAKPRLVAWDFYFRKPQPGDGEFARGALSLHQAGVPIALAVDRFGADGVPDVAPTLYEPLRGAVRFGAILGRDPTRREGEFVLAIRRGEEVLPSLPLVAFAGLMQPDALPWVEWPSRQKGVELRYRGDAQGRPILRKVDWIDLTTVVRNPRDQWGAKRDDLLGCAAFHLTDLDRWDAATVPYARVLEMSDAELVAAFGGRIVLFGDLRGPGTAGRADRHTVRCDGREFRNVPGCYLIGEAIGGLLKQSYTRRLFPLSAPTLVGCGLVAVLGCLLALPLARRPIAALTPRRRAAVLWLTALTAAAGASAMARSHNYAAVQVGMAFLALSLAAAGSLWIEFTRNQRRIDPAVSVDTRHWSAA